MKVFQGIFAVIFLTSVIMLGGKYVKDKENEEIYEDLREQVFIWKYDDTEENLTMFPEVNEVELSKINQEYVAWLYIPGTIVNYPVVFPSNNQEYLNKMFDGQKGACGSLFFDSQNEPMVLLNTIIHGHNMRNGTMFGELKKYLTEGFPEEHSQLYLYQNGIWSQYQLYAVYRVKQSDAFPYTTMFLSQEEFQKYVKKIRQRSIYQTDAEEEIKNVLTLSTCYGKQEKLIVQWVNRREEYE